MKITKLNTSDKTRDLELDFGDAGKVAMTVVPKKFNIGLQRRLKAAQKDGDIAGMADHFFSVVQAWDLEGEDGKPLPLTDEGIDQLEIEAFGEIVTKMTEALNPS